MKRFSSTGALVSGAARGMGASHVRGLVAEGARVVVGDVLDLAGKALAADLGTAVRYVHLDVTDASQWGQAVQTAESEFGPVTLLVNNAGNVAFGGIDSMTAEDFRRVIDSISPGRGLACMRR